MLKKVLLASLLATLVGLSVAGEAAASSGPFSSLLSATMTTGRAGAYTAPLPDGRLLIAGGSNGGVLQTAEVFDPATETFSKLSAGLKELRYGAASAPLPDGKVLIVGGTYFSVMANGELFDPATETFSALGHELNIARAGAVAVPLPDGKVLIAGGEGASTIKVAELFDPTTNTFTALSGAEHEMNEARGYPLAAKLPDGKILIAGGSSGFLNQASAEIFDPATDSFTLLKGTGRYMTTPRRNAVSAVLPSGAVLIAGGTNGVDLMSAEVFDPTTETFTALNGSGQALSQPRTSSFAASLPDGRVLIAGGQSGFSSVASAEVLNVPPARALVEGGDFGSQVVGRPAGTQTLIVDAVGAEPLSILGATIAGTNPGDFTIVGNSCEELVLSFRQICTITARFTPSASGARTAALVLHDNEPGGSTVTLMGTGIAPESGQGQPGLTGPAGSPGAAGPRGVPGSAACTTTSLGLWLTRAAKAAQGPMTIKVACGWRHLPSASRARITRGRVLFASGPVSWGQGTPRLVLHARRALRPGYYTLTLIDGYGAAARGTHRAVTILGS